MSFSNKPAVPANLGKCLLQQVCPAPAWCKYLKSPEKLILACFVCAHTCVQFVWTGDIYA